MLANARGNHLLRYTQNIIFQPSSTSHANRSIIKRYDKIFYMEAIVFLNNIGVRGGGGGGGGISK